MAEEEDHTFSENQCSSSRNSLMGARSVLDSDSGSEDSYVEDDIEDEIFISDLEEDGFVPRELDRQLEPYRHLLPVLSTLSAADKVHLQDLLYRVGITAALSVSNFLEMEQPNSPSPTNPPAEKDASISRPLQMLEDRYLSRYGREDPLGPFGPQSQQLVSMLFKYGIFEDCSEMVTQIREKMSELMGSGQIPKTTITENVENDIAAASLAAVSTSLHRNPPTHQLEILMTAASHETSTQACSESDSTSTCSKPDDDDKSVYKGSLSSPITLTDDMVAQGLMDPLPLDDDYDRLRDDECDEDDLDDEDESDIDTSSLLHSIEDEEAGMMNQDYLLRFAAVMAYDNLLETLVKLGNTEFGTCQYSSPLLEACAAGQESSVKILISHEADVNAYTEQGNTPLIFACAIGKIEIVKALLDVKSIDAFKKNLNGHDCLMEAACAGHLDIVKYLAENVYNEYFSPNKMLHLAEGEKETGLTLAAYKGCLEIVQFLLTQYIPSKQELYIALTETSIDGHYEIAKLLLDHGSPVNMKTETFDSPLSMAAGSGHADLVRVLVEKGADLELINDDQFTPLMESCREGHLELVTILLDAGCKIDALTPNTETALTLAAAHGSLPIVQLLLSRGSDIFLGNPSALFECTQEGHQEVVQYLIHRLLELRASHTKEVNEDLNRSFLVAIDMNHREIAEVLVSTGVNIDFVGKDGRTALMNACRLGHTPVVEFLLQRGASVNIEMPNKEGTALSLAALHGYPDIVTVLLDGGADSSRLLRDSVTCVLEAARHGHTQCVELLLKHHAKHQSTTKPSSVSTPISTGNASTTSTANRTATTTTTPSACTHHGDNGMQKLPAHGPACSQMHHALPGHPASMGTCQHYNHPRSSAAHRAARQRQKNKSHAGHGRDCPFHGCANNLPDDPTHLPLSPASYTDLQNYHHVQAAIAAGRSLMTRGRETFTDEQVKQFTDAVSSNMRNIPQGLVEAFDKPFDTADLTCHGHSHAHGHGHAHGHDHSHASDPPRTKSASGAGVKRKSSGSKDTEIHCAHVTSGPTKASNVAMPPLPSDKSLLAHGSITAQFTTKDIREMFQLGTVAPPPALAAAVSACGFDPVNSSGTVTLSRNTTCNHQKEVVQKHTHTFTTGTKGKLPTASISITATTGPCATKEGQKKGKRTVKNTKDMQKLKELQLASQKAQEKRRNTSDVVDIIDIQTESNHDTALTLACAGGYTDLVDLLIRKGADVEHRDKKGFTPLVLAATGGHVDCVKHLLDASCMVDAVSERTKDTALSLACSGGRKEVVEMLLKANANKEHRNVSDYTPLSLAASGGYIEIIQLLLNAGAEINSRTGSKLCISPLMLAAMNGHEAATKLLLERGSDINAHIETNRNTALTLACFQGRVEVVRLLLKFNANVEHRAKTGLTPLMEAANGGYSSVGKLLLEHTADPNASPVPSSRDTALTIAADKGHYQFVDLLIRHGANINARNKKGCTAVWLACNGGHLETLKTLISHRADVDLQDSRKTSPLMTAFRKGHLKIIRFLVKHVQQFPGDSECHRYLQTFPEKDKELEEKCRQCLEVILRAKDKQAAQAEAAAESLLNQLAEEQEQAASRMRSKQRKNEEKKAKRQAKKAEELEIIRLRDLAAAEEAEAKRRAKEEAKRKAAELKRQKEEEALKEAQEALKKVELESELAQEQEEQIPQKEETPICSDIEEQIEKIEQLEKLEEWTEVAPVITEKKEKVIEVVNNGTSRSRRSTRREAAKLSAATIASRNMLSKSELDSEWFKAGGLKKKPLPTSKAPSKGASAAAATKGELSDDGGVWNNIESSKRRQQVMNLASSQIARVIGRGGVNINAIREATYANIEVEKQSSSRNQGPRNITIKGNSEAVKNAVAMIEILLKEVDLGINQIVSRVIHNKHSASPSLKSESANEHGASQNAADAKPVPTAGSNVWEQRAAIRQGLHKDDIPPAALELPSKKTSTASSEAHHPAPPAPVPAPAPIRTASPVSTVAASIGSNSVGCPSPHIDDVKVDNARGPSPEDFSKRRAPGSERTSNTATPVANGETTTSHIMKTISPISMAHPIPPTPLVLPSLEKFTRNMSPAPQEVPTMPSRLESVFSAPTNTDVSDILPRFNQMSMFNTPSNKDENELRANLFAPESKLCDIWGSDRNTDVNASLTHRLGNGGLVDPVAAVWMNGSGTTSPPPTNSYAKDFAKEPQQLQQDRYGFSRTAYATPQNTEFTPWSDGSNVPAAQQQQPQQEWGSSRTTMTNRQSTWDTLIPGSGSSNSNKYGSSAFGSSNYEHTLNRQGMGSSDMMRSMADGYDMSQKTRNDAFSGYTQQNPAHHRMDRMNQSLDMRRSNMYSNHYDATGAATGGYSSHQPSMQPSAHETFESFPRERSMSYYNQMSQQQFDNRQFRSPAQTQAMRAEAMRSGNGVHQNFGSIGEMMSSGSSNMRHSHQNQGFGAMNSQFFMQNDRQTGAMDMQSQYGMGSSSRPSSSMYTNWSNSSSSAAQQQWSNGSTGSGSRNIW